MKKSFFKFFYVTPLVILLYNQGKLVGKSFIIQYI